MHLFHKGVAAAKPKRGEMIWLGRGGCQKKSEGTKLGFHECLTPLKRQDKLGPSLI